MMRRQISFLYHCRPYYWSTPFSAVLSGKFLLLENPHLIFWPFANGKFVGLPGMSYHGGLVGAVVGAVLFCRRNKNHF